VALLLFLRKSNLLVHLASAGVAYVTRGLVRPEGFRHGNLAVIIKMLFLSERKRSPKGMDHEVILRFRQQELRR